jgi:hypothetical protein
LSILPLLQAQLLFLRWEQDRYYAPLCCPDTPYIYLRSFRPYLALAFIDAIQASFIALQKNYFVIWFATCRTYVPRRTLFCPRTHPTVRNCPASNCICSFFSRRVLGKTHILDFVACRFAPRLGRWIQLTFIRQFRATEFAGVFRKAGKASHPADSRLFFRSNHFANCIRQLSFAFNHDAEPVCRQGGP